ncbi:hypothetical protein ABZ799_28865 [Nocardiopsis dassonvillei]|uniref:hypothetical protein n=1 Tax=Nocardiopsis dassonvillei TaxID=2014 RepID=UPI0033C1EB90
MNAPRWEYRLEEGESGLHPGQLRNLGAKGWELVSEVAIPDPKSRTGYRFRAVFKMPKE